LSRRVHRKGQCRHQIRPASRWRCSSSTSVAFWHRLEAGLAGISGVSQHP
jgi:hypothetical protein